MMEKGWIAQRQYHEKSGRAVRSDKFLTVEDKKAKARVMVKAAEWRLLNPKPRWAPHRRPFRNNLCMCTCRKRPKGMALLPLSTPKLEGCRMKVCSKCHQPRMVVLKPAPSPDKIAAKLGRKDQT